MKKEQEAAQPQGSHLVNVNDFLQELCLLSLGLEAAGCVLNLSLRLGHCPSLQSQDEERARVAHYESGYSTGLHSGAG